MTKNFQSIRDLADRHQKPKIILSMHGGIGNQLFILSFGLVQKLRNSLDVRFIFAKQGLGNNNHGQNLLRHLSIEHDLVQRTEGFFLFAFIRLARLLARNKRIRAILSSLGIRFVNEKEIDSQYCKIKEESIKPKLIFISGYFQSRENLEFLQSMNTLLTLESKDPSEWYLQLSRKLDFENSIALHVRRGDFQKSISHGVLSMTYYSNALQYLSGRKPLDIKVFSDEPHQVMVETGTVFNGHSVEFIESPVDGTDLESCILLSRFRKLVIGNSTFGWWAASTGPQIKHVIAPKYWHPSELLPSTLNNPRWKTITPIWK